MTETTPTAVTPGAPDRLQRGPEMVARTRRAVSPTGGEAYLSVRDLRVEFPTAEGVVKAVQGLSYDLPLGRTLAIVGESGSGKSVSSMAIMGLHDLKRTRITGSIKLGGDELVGLSSNDMRKYRGQVASMIFQDPQSSLHPYFKVGWQISEAYREHHNVSRAVARRRSLELLDRVGIPNPQRRIDQYPFEFSGGMRQRAMIAMALVNDPKLLIADEPTTALDVTVQAQILDLLNDLQKEFGSAIIMITHDLGVVSEVADDVLVMYAGRAVEYGTAEEVLLRPNHPYAWGLLESIPSVNADAEQLRPIRGNPPSLVNVPSGCPFHPRCRYPDRVEGDACVTVLPELVAHYPGVPDLSRCHLKDPAEIFRSEVQPGLA
ncbi:MAG TPA: ABC transporter ATP-binding protein [Intrasporangium sp.]|uniref:ABC transporter ATP-binding protein n=1 Tax=Intrasporangium sp. TaxID=1925024 RepID=UPI002D7A3576|nr:ABC transporter ATP-binding protein [Intrasporangium sp.]HET7399512.1 ABC transporter ATP-binding protein [Intrasporangium sp.]